MGARSSSTPSTPSPSRPSKADDLVDEGVAVGHGRSDPLVVHAKMLRLELLRVKADLERELEDFVLKCSTCGLDVHWVSGLGFFSGALGAPGAGTARRACRVVNAEK